MKLKQILLVVAISATSAIGSVWTYGKLTGKNDTGFVQSTTNGKLPENYKYAGFNDGVVGNAAEPIDFTKAAQAAVPAVVHIKTKIPARKVSNNLPRSRGNSMDDWFNDFF